MAESKSRMKIGIIPSLSENEYGLDEKQLRTSRFSDVREAARMAEDIGADSFWLADHLIFRFPDQPTGGQWDVFTVLGGVAAVTSRIQIGPLVACTSFRNPALLAKIADTLDDMSDGRLFLGLGAGWHKPEYDAFGYPFDHLASRFEEALQIIIPLLQEGKVDFKGEYYEARECELHPRGPSKKGPPILIGARRPRMLDLIAKHADAYNTVWHKSAESVEQPYQTMIEACKAAGRDPATLQMTAGTFARVLAPGEPRPENPTGICGEPEEVAMALKAFERYGTEHLIVILEPEHVRSVERFGKVIELMNKM